jgi:pimeloyl-ACP methyl ester carboxylesterase
MMLMHLATAIACAKSVAALYQGDVGPNVLARTTDTEVLVERMATGHYAIIFPGTASVRDARTDVRVWKTAWSSGSVHRGFAAAWHSVADTVASIVPAGAHVIIAGHSLGGALATLCAETLWATHTIDQVYTFGSPRVGNGPFARAYAEKCGHVTWRVVNQGDPVPHVPWMAATYRHVGIQIYLTDDGRLLRDCITRAALLDFWRRAAALADPDDRLDALLNVAGPHGITQYIGKLEGIKS